VGIEIDIPQFKSGATMNLYYVYVRIRTACLLNLRNRCLSHFALREFCCLLLLFFEHTKAIKRPRDDHLPRIRVFVHVVSEK